MANTDVSISNHHHAPAAHPNSVSVVEDDTFTIAVSGDPVVLFFSPDIISVLSPTPGASVKLSGTDTLQFTFTSSEEGVYEIAYGGVGAAAPLFPPAASNDLQFKPAARGRSGQSQTLQGNN